MMSPFDDTLEWLLIEQPRSAQAPARLCTHANDVRCRDSCAFRICCLSVRSLTYCRCGAKGYEAYHWACAEYVQNTSTQKPLIAGYLPMSSFGKNRTKKMMKRETAKKKRAKKKTTRATQSDHRVSLVVRLSFLPSRLLKNHSQSTA